MPHSYGMTARGHLWLLTGISPEAVRLLVAIPKAIMKVTSQTCQSRAPMFQLVMVEQDVCFASRFAYQHPWLLSTNTAWNLRLRHDTAICVLE